MQEPPQALEYIAGGPTLRRLFLDMFHGRCVTRRSDRGTPVIHPTARVDRIHNMIKRAAQYGYTIVTVPGPHGGEETAHYFLLRDNYLPDCDYCQSKIPQMVMRRLTGGAK